MIIRKYETAAITEGSDLYVQLLRIVESRYNTGRHTLQYGLSFSTVVYTAWLDDQCCGFCMASYKLLAPEGMPETMSLYMGLTARKPEDNCKTSIFHVISALRNDALQYADSRNENMPVWATTSSPAAFSLFHSAFRNTEPAIKGTFGNTSVRLATAIKKQFYSDPQFHDIHPFVLRGISKTAYSGAEHERVAHMSKTRGYWLFSGLNIDDTAGDRLLMIGWLKDHPADHLF